MTTIQWLLLIHIFGAVGTTILALIMSANKLKGGGAFEFIITVLAVFILMLFIWPFVWLVRVFK